MQYQSNLDASATETLLCKDFLGKLDVGDVERAVALCHDQALLTVQTSSRLFAGKPAVKEMLKKMRARYAEVEHIDVRFTTDAAHGRLTAATSMRLLSEDGTSKTLSTTYFWRFRDGRVQEIYIYSNDDAALL